MSKLLIFVISNSVSGVIYLSTDVFFSPNNFSILFDYTSLNSSDLFLVSVCPYTSSGVGTCDVRYFNIVFESEDPGLPSGVAFVIAVFFVVTGFTFASVSAVVS